MKNRFLVLGLAILSLSSCRTALSVAKVSAEKNISLSKDLPEDAAFTKVIEPYKAELEGKMNTKISYTNVDLNKQGDNSNLGNLLADFTFEGADDWARKNGIPNGVDAAVINVGGIRSTIGKGDILTKHIYEVMPFENELVLVKMKYENMLELFDYYVKYQKNNPVSGLYIEVENNQLKKALINGNELDKNKTYYIATSDFLAYGGDDMKFFNKGEIIPTGIKLRDLYIDFFKKNPVIKVNQETRLLFKK